MASHENRQPLNLRSIPLSFHNDLSIQGIPGQTLIVARHALKSKHPVLSATLIPHRSKPHRLCLQISSQVHLTTLLRGLGYKAEQGCIEGAIKQQCMQMQSLELRAFSMSSLGQCTADTPTYQSCTVVKYLRVLLQHSMAANDLRTAENSATFLAVLSTNPMPIRLIVSFNKFAFPAEQSLQSLLCCNVRLLSCRGSCTETLL